MVDEEEPVQSQESEPCAQELHESSGEDEHLLPNMTVGTAEIEKPDYTGAGKVTSGERPARFANLIFVKGAAALLCLTALVGGVILLRHSRPGAVPAATKGPPEVQEENQEESGHASIWPKNTIQGWSQAFQMAKRSILLYKHGATDLLNYFAGDQPTSIGHWQEPWGECTIFAK